MREERTFDVHRFQLVLEDKHRSRGLRVRGAANLHVADSSSFPAIPNGNVHSTVVAVAAEAAERLADGILGVGG